jgi:L-ascorbate metabolism protein UlaG (beta-lactamase superfamily)
MQLHASGVKILVDPWLVGKLVFVEQQWFFEGANPFLKGGPPDLERFTKDIDFILLSQGLDDHAHKPTLKALPKSIPIVCSPPAAEIARTSGFKTVLTLDHGETVRGLARLSSFCLKPSP